MSILGDLFGFSSAPKTSDSAVKTVEAEDDKTKKLRTALYATEGGASGQEVTATGAARSTLFGN
jgi:hypothetical protein